MMRSQRLLAALHDDVMNFASMSLLNSVRKNGADRSLSSAGHRLLPLFLARLAPYFERPLLTLATRRSPECPRTV